jgi:hypothetical protein
MPATSGENGIGGLIALVRALGQSLIEVVRAELHALGEDFRRSGHHLWVAVALLCGAAALLFWTMGAVLFALVAILNIWLRLWAAALIVVGVFVLAAGLLVLLASRHLRRLESPAADVKKRLADHLDWWQNRLLAEPGAPPPPAASTAPGRPIASHSLDREVPPS